MAIGQQQTVQASASFISSCNECESRQPKNACITYLLLILLRHNDFATRPQTHAEAHTHTHTAIATCTYVLCPRKRDTLRLLCNAKIPFQGSRGGGNAKSLTDVHVNVARFPTACACVCVCVCYLCVCVFAACVCACVRVLQLPN